MSAYPRPIHCAKCEMDLIPEKNGVSLIELFQQNTKPYCIWQADLWKCPKCGVEIISGYGQIPIYHFDENFQSLLAHVTQHGQMYFNRE